MVIKKRIKILICPIPKVNLTGKEKNINEQRKRFVGENIDVLYILQSIKSTYKRKIRESITQTFDATSKDKKEKGIKNNKVSGGYDWVVK